MWLHRCGAEQLSSRRGTDAADVTPICYLASFLLSARSPASTSRPKPVFPPLAQRTMLSATRLRTSCLSPPGLPRQTLSSAASMRASVRISKPSAIMFAAPKGALPLTFADHHNRERAPRFHRNAGARHFPMATRSSNLRISRPCCILPRSHQLPSPICTL